MRIARATQHPALQLFVTQMSLQSAGLADFPLSPDQAKHVLRRYSQLCVQSRRDLVEAALRKARAHAQADKGGFLFVKVSCDRLSRCSLHCRCCALTFDTAAALGAHLAKIHAQAAPAAYGFGTACESCRKQFWSTARLREHLRRARRCARVYVEADWPPGQAPETLASGQTPPMELIAPHGGQCKVLRRM